MSENDTGVRWTVVLAVAIVALTVAALAAGGFIIWVGVATQQLMN